MSIGIFDSGIGGLTIARAIQNILPNETIVYFGDTAHLPYGNKSQALVKEYAEKITRYLIEEEGCSSIVIACNTASAAAYEYLRDTFQGSVPIINVIDPVIEAIVANDAIKKVGIIATSTTVDSGVYQEKLTRRKPTLEYVVLPTPLLAPMIEEGFYKGAISREVIHNYLVKPELQDIDALVLACTHYPLIKDEISDYYNGRVQIIDAPDIVAEKLRGILDKEGLLSDTKQHEDIYYVSYLTESFKKTTELFFGKAVPLKHKEV